MRNKFIFFLALSLIVHLVILSVLDIKPEEQPDKKPDPVTVTVVPKQKEPKPEPKMPPKPPEIIEDMPLDEELDTKIDQMAPVPREGQAAREETQQSPAEPKAPEPQPERESETESILSDESPVEMPRISPEEPERDAVTEKERENILNPTDIIEKYAREGIGTEGQDHVSMQYVKLRYQSYFHKFARRLYQVWVYPRDAAYRGEHGTVEISFVISRDGMISSIKVVRSSGYPDLDREAVTALRKTAGVPLPESYELDFLKVDAYFRYVLGGGYVVY